MTLFEHEEEDAVVDMVAMSHSGPGFSPLNGQSMHFEGKRGLEICRSKSWNRKTIRWPVVFCLERFHRVCSQTKNG